MAQIMNRNAVLPIPTNLPLRSPASSANGHRVQRKITKRIKWGSATRTLEFRPERTDELQTHLVAMDEAPRAHDVFLAEVIATGRHTGIELDGGRKASFDEGDVLGVVFGNRYATKQFLGEVPPLSDEYHMLSQGGVCGQVISSPESFAEPTLLKPLGYLANPDGTKVNLRNFALKRASVPKDRATTILVLGSSMDAGKTTTAKRTIRGLVRAGLRVNAGKLTGTACAKDPQKMFDAGAWQVLDFTHVGFASTSQASEADLGEIADVLISNLSADSPDFIVLEIADGITQRETRLLVSYMVGQGMIDNVLLAVHDAMAAPTCLSMLADNWQLTPSLISGAATVTPLSTQELQQLSNNIPCLGRVELAEPDVVKHFSR